MKPGADVEIRPAISTDSAFILKTWLSEYSSSEFARRIDRETYRIGHGKYATALLARGAVVAVLPDSRDVITGFLVGAGSVLHFMFVRAHFRGFGIASRMMDAVFADAKRLRYTHTTEAGRAILAPRGARYDPYQ